MYILYYHIEYVTSIAHNETQLTKALHISIPYPSK